MTRRRTAPEAPATLVDPDAVPRPVFVLDAWHEATTGAVHTHRRAQLVHAAEGVITITTPEGRWVAPPQRAVWVPGGTAHAAASRRPFRLRTLYVEPEIAPLPDACRVVSVDRLVEELLAAAAAFGSDYAPGGPEERLVRVILDRLPVLAAAPLLHLPEPKSPDLRKITAALIENPADDRTLDAWAAHIGMTKRTAARRFAAEAGVTFGRFRQQLRLLAAVERLGAGESVTAVAFEVGYEDVSSFISAFKAAMGETPARYFKTLGEAQSDERR